MSVISEAIEASFTESLDQEKAHEVAEALAEAMNTIQHGKGMTVADGTVGLAIYCAHYIEQCCTAGEDAPDKEMHFFEALGGFIRKFLLRPGGPVEHRKEQEHD